VMVLGIIHTAGSIIFVPGLVPKPRPHSHRVDGGGW
jgi:hypothetical protein